MTTILRLVLGLFRLLSQLELQPILSQFLFPLLPEDLSFSTVKSSVDYTQSIFGMQDQEVREGLKKYSDWPTYPQLYAGGEFLGGCDIILEQLEEGQLKENIEEQLAQVNPRAA